MKSKNLFKGIVTLVIVLMISMLLRPALAFAAGTSEPKLNVKSKSIVKGKEYALKVYNLSETQTVAFSSENQKIASIDEEGVVHALAIGTTTVSAVISDTESEITVKLSCKITVGPPAFFVLFSRKEVDLSVGQRSLMYCLLSPLNTVEQPKFFSSDPEVASVSAGGLVTAKSEGTAYIFAKIDNGQFDVCRIVVSPEADEEYTAELLTEEETFADFLIKLNENFTNGDNTSEDTGAATAQ